MIAEVARMIVPAKQTKAAAGPPDISAQVTEAISSRDAKLVEALLRDIGMAPESVSRRADAIVSVAHHHNALNSVVTAAVYLLESLKRDVAGDLARRLLSEPVEEDRELVRATAIRALIESGTLGISDLPVVARSLSSRLSYVRAACQRAIRGLTGGKRKSLEDLVGGSSEPGIEQLKLFVRALEPEAPARAQQLTPPPAPKELSDEERAARRAAKTAAVARRASEERVRRFREAEARKAQERREAEEVRKEPSRPRNGTSSQRACGPAEVPPPDHEPRECSVPSNTPNLPPSSVASIAALRNPALVTAPLDALRATMARASTAEEFVAAAAEVAHRFGLETARSSADRTLWFLSHPDFSRNEGLLALSRALFS